MKPSDLSKFSDNELRTLYKAIRSYVCKSAEEMKNFDEENEWIYKSGTTALSAMRKSVAFTSCAICELRRVYSKTIRHESPETLDWSSMEATFTCAFDAEAYQATLDGLVKLIS